MAYQPKNYDSLLGTPGFSDTLLKNHFTLYQGYVTNTNKLSDEMASLLAENKGATPQFAELTRRFGWEFNGMRLHEIYFGNMKKGGAALDAGSALAEQIKQDFGSYDDWQKAFKAVGAMRGIGWALLSYDPEGKKLHNVWINEHNVNHLAGTAPILIMDVFEHAFMIDYGLKRADYIEAFFKSIDWPVAARRFSAASRELSAV